MINRSEEFDLIWDEHIKPLKGQTVFTLKMKKKNTITDVGNDFLERSSSNNKISRIKKQKFREVYYWLKEKKTLTREEINKEYPIRALQ